MKHWDKYDIGGSIESELEAFDVSKLDAFEQMQYSDFIKHSTKAEALKILINNVEGDFSQLSPNLNDIAEMYYPVEDNYFMDDNYADGGKVFEMAKLSMKPYAFKEKIKFVKENPEILAGKFANGGGVSDDELISVKKKLISILSSLDKKDLFDFIYYIGGVESNYVDRVVSIYEDWINDLPKDELDMLLWRMKQPYFYEFSGQDNFRKGIPVPSKFATHNDFYEKKYKNGGGIKTDFNDLNNEGLRKALISFREDFNNFLSNYLQVGKENYILSNIDNVMVIFRDKSLGDFSDVENVAINKWIQPYFDISKRPLIAEYLNGYKIDGNRIIIYIKDSQMYANGGGVGSGYMVFNYTDNLYASNDIFATKKEANNFISQFRKRFEQQGYYRDSNMNKIDIDDIDLLVIDENFNPFRYANGGGIEKGEEKINKTIYEVKPYTVYQDEWGDNVRKYSPKIITDSLAESEKLVLSNNNKALVTIKRYNKDGKAVKKGDTIENISTYGVVIDSVYGGNAYITIKGGEFVNESFDVNDLVTSKNASYSDDGSKNYWILDSSNKNTMANGGGVSDLQFTSKTLTKSKESKLKEKLFDGRISEVDLKNIIGFEPNYPTQIVGTIKLEKCFLLPYYKII